MESETEAWTSDELDYASIVRRQIQKVMGTMGPNLTGSTVSAISLAVQGLRSLLGPYMGNEDQEAVGAIMREYHGKIEKSDPDGLVLLRYERSLKVLEALLGIAKQVGVLLEEDMVEGSK